MSSKPRVCFISTLSSIYGLLTGNPVNNRIGGAEVQQCAIALGLCKLGYDIVFAIPDMGLPEEVVTVDGISVVQIPSVGRRIQGLGRLQSMMSVHKAMKRARADVYYVRCAGYLAGFAAMFCRLNRKPLVCAIASNLDLDSQNRSWLQPSDRSWYLRGLRHSSAIVVQSADQECMLARTMGREGVLIRSTFQDEDPNADRTQASSVLWVGTIRDVKRPLLFVQLAAAIPESRFVLVGGRHQSNPALFDKIVEAAESLPNLELTGFVPYNEVHAYFSNARVLVNTSEAEGFPNTFLHAWSKGVPVVSTFDADGLLAGHGLGMYCSSIDDLVAGTKRLLTDDELRRSIGERAVEYVNANHSQEVICAQYDDLFSGLVAKGNRR